jgi:hypothetical protein
MVLIVTVGYNETADGYGTGIDRVTRAAIADGAAGVVWVNLREERSGYRLINGAIRQAATRWLQLLVSCLLPTGTRTARASPGLASMVSTSPAPVRTRSARSCSPTSSVPLESARDAGPTSRPPLEVEFAVAKPKRDVAPERSCAPNAKAYSGCSKGEASPESIPQDSLVRALRPFKRLCVKRRRPGDIDTLLVKEVLLVYQN